MDDTARRLLWWGLTAGLGYVASAYVACGNPRQDALAVTWMAVLLVSALAYALWRAKHVDILVSHAPADGVCDGKDLCHRGFPAFNAIIERFHPRYFIHGHQHMSYGSGPRVSDYRGTSVINSEGYYIFEY